MDFSLVLGGNSGGIPLVFGGRDGLVGVLEEVIVLLGVLVLLGVVLEFGVFGLLARLLVLVVGGFVLFGALLGVDGRGGVPSFLVDSCIYLYHFQH